MAAHRKLVTSTEPESQARNSSRKQQPGIFNTQTQNNFEIDKMLQTRKGSGSSRRNHLFGSHRLSQENDRSLQASFNGKIDPKAFTKAAKTIAQPATLSNFFKSSFNSRVGTKKLF